MRLGTRLGGGGGGGGGGRRGREAVRALPITRSGEKSTVGDDRPLIVHARRYAYEH